MATRDNPYIENLTRRIDEIPLLGPESLARVLPLYIKSMNDNSVVRNLSMAYIDGYDGKSMYRKFKRFYDRMYEMFLREGVGEAGRRTVFKGVARREFRVPKTMKEMEILSRKVYEEVRSFMRSEKLNEARQKLVVRFKNAVKKYLHLTWELGFNEPSACAKSLAQHHKIDKYVMSGDFPVILLPFLPDVEAEIKRCYEHYEMQDAWEMLKGRYFNHRAEYMTLAVEIKSTFNKTIPNFSDYFDGIYTDTYYNLMLERSND